MYKAQGVELLWAGNRFWWGRKTGVQREKNSRVKSRTLFANPRKRDASFTSHAHKLNNKQEHWRHELDNTYNPGQKNSGHLPNFGRKVENLLYMTPSLYEQRVFFFRCLFRVPLPPRQCWNMRAIDERILISVTVKNQHCNGGKGEKRNCPNSFDQDCIFEKAQPPCDDRPPEVISPWCQSGFWCRRPPVFL